MSKVIDLSSFTGIVNRLQGNGEPPDNDAMEARVVKLEEFALDTRDRLARIETKLDGFMTKTDGAALQSDIHKSTSDMIKWIVGSAIALGAVGITVITFVLNNATPKQIAVATPTAPVVIYMPNPTATAPAPAPAATASAPAQQGQKP